MTERLLLTIADVCRATSLSRTTIYGLVRAGELPAVRIGRSVRIRAATLNRWLAEQEDAGGASSGSSEDAALLRPWR